MAAGQKIFYTIAMTIKKQMYVSNVLMVLVPLLVMVLLFGGTYLRMDALLESDAGGISSEISHELREIRELLLPVHDVFMKFVVALALVFGTLIFLSVFLSNYFLSRSFFRRIMEPLSLLENSVHRIQRGDLEHPLNYGRQDEFTDICAAVDLLSSKLKEAMIARQKDEQSRKELVAGISHDLRTPLTAIRACCESLVEGIPASHEQRASYLGLILEKELVIERMISQLFLFSKMELDTFPLKLEVFSPKKLIEKTARSFAASSRKFEFSLRCEPGCRIRADREQFERIVQNCIGNSLKYSDRDIPSLGAEVKSDGERVHVLFTDDGPGADGREAALKNKEYELLVFLMSHRDMVFDRETLYEEVWGLETMGDNATVVVHINRIREKIEEDPSDPEYIETVWGAGYRFCVPE